MPGQWLVTQVALNQTLSTTAVTQQVVTVDLPRANFISRLTGMLNCAGTDTSTVTLDRVRVIANGSAVLWDSEGGQLRGVNKFQNGSVTPGAAISTTNQFWPFTVNFGRYFRDEDVICPAKIFKSLQLQLTFTPAVAGVTGVSLTLNADEYVSNDDVKSKFIRKVSLVSTTASAANLLTRARLPLGNFLRAVYVHTDDPDNVNGASPMLGGVVAAPSLIRVLVNNGAEIPFAAPLGQIKLSNQETYRFDDADTPDTELTNAAAFTGTEEMVCIDFDVLDNLAKMLDTSRMNELSVEFTAAGSGTSGDTHVLTDEIVAIA